MISLLSFDYYFFLIFFSEFYRQFKSNNLIHSFRIVKSLTKSLHFEYAEKLSFVLEFFLKPVLHPDTPKWSKIQYGLMLGFLLRFHNSDFL